MSDNPLKDIIKNVISGLEKREKKELDLLNLWEKAAGEKAAKHTRPCFLKKKRLVVNVSDSSWLYKLTLGKDKIMQDVNKNLKNRQKIKELQFRIGDIKHGEKEDSEKRP